MKLSKNRPGNNILISALLLVALSFSFLFYYPFQPKVAGATALAGIAVSVGSTTLSATTSYTVTFTAPQNLDVNTTINLNANANGPVSVAPSFANATIDSGSNQTNVNVSIIPPTGPNNSNSAVSLILNTAITSGTSVKIVLANVVNPTQAAQYKLNVNINPASNQPPSPENSLMGSANFLLGYSTIRTITGKVTLSTTGAAITDAMVTANQRGGQLFLNADANSTGDYTLSVPAGEWEVRVNAQFDQGTGQMKVVNWAYTGMGSTTNTNDSNQVVNFSVIPATAKVKGKIVKPDGSPLTMGGLDIRSTEGVGVGSPLNQQGQFEVQIPGGGYRINVFSQDADFATPPLDPFTIDDNQTKDFGTITLVKKTSRLKGTVTDKSSGAGIGNVRINAWSRDAGGWGQATTGSNGSFELLVGVGTWEVMVQPSPDLGYAVESGPPTQITIAANETKDGIVLKLTKANSTIKGKIVDANGTQLTDFFGFAMAMEGSGDPPKPGPGGQIQGGQFSLKVPAGTWMVNANTPPGSEYSSTGGKQVTIADGASTDITIAMMKNNATISGTVRDEEGNAVSNFGRAEVFAENGKGSFKMAQVAADGTYRMGVVSGDGWFMGVFVDPSSGYMMLPPSDNKITVASGETKSKDFTLLKANATITGKVLDPDGNGLSNVFVFADTNLTKDGNVLGIKTSLPANSGGPVEGGGKGMGKGIQTGNLTDSSGNFSLKVPAGTYGLGSGAPPALGFINPEFAKVTVAKDETKTGVTLKYKKSDGKISGSVKLDGVNTEAHIWAWSDKGSHSDTHTRTGEFTLNVTKGDVWHIGGDYGTNQKFYQSNEYVVDLSNSASASQNIELAESNFKLPAPVSQTIDASAGGTIQLENSFSLVIPAGAFASSGNYTVTITPTTGLVQQKNNRPLFFGYSITAVDSSGQTLTSNFNSNVRLIIPYTEEMLAELGITEDDLNASFFDTTSDGWQGVDSFTVNKEDNTIIGSVSHFTEFALTTGSADTTPPSDPTGVAATVSGTKVSLKWTNPSDSDLDHINIYRSAALGSLGSLAGSTTSATATSYDDSGLTANTTYYYTLTAVDAVGNESTGTTQVSATTTSQLPNTGIPLNSALQFYLARTSIFVLTIGLIYFVKRKFKFRLN
jgi:hypothetical protein